MKKKKNQNKGQKGYLAWNKKMSICKTLVLFAISFAVYAMGIWSTGSNQNLLTIVAVLGCLPACRSAANLIAPSACPFCGNPIVLTGQFAGDLRPDLTNRITAKSLQKSGQRKALPIWNLPATNVLIRYSIWHYPGWS